MMGVIAGTNDQVQDLKKLLELVSDPKKIADVLGKIEMAQKEEARLIAEKTAINEKAEANLKSANEAIAKIQSDKLECVKQTQDLIAKQNAFNQEVANYSAQKAKLGQDMIDFVAAKGEFEKRSTALTNEMVNAKALLQKTQTEAEALREELKGKLQALRTMTA